MSLPSAETWESFWREKRDSREIFSNDGRVLKNLLEVVEPRGKRILEVGAGTGRDSLGLARLGGLVFQLDYSMEALRLARRSAMHEGAKVRLVAGDALEAPFPAETFDVVLHQGLLEHFRAPEAELLLRENLRVLKRDGLLLVDVPQRYHPYTILKHILIALKSWFAGWEREFSVRELERELETLGLVSVRTYGVWMYPSLFYRVLREGLSKVGVRLPLDPPKVPVLSTLRARSREAALGRRVALNTCFSIGVIARRP